MKSIAREAGVRPLRRLATLIADTLTPAPRPHFIHSWAIFANHHSLSSIESTPRSVYKLPAPGPYRLSGGLTTMKDSQDSPNSPQLLTYGRRDFISRSFLAGSSLLLAAESRGQTALTPNDDLAIANTVG